MVWMTSEGCISAIPPIEAWGSQLRGLRCTLDSETSVEFAEADTENSRVLQNISSWDFFFFFQWNVEAIRTLNVTTVSYSSFCNHTERQQWQLHGTCLLSPEVKCYFGSFETCCFNPMKAAWTLLSARLLCASGQNRGICLLICTNPAYRWWTGRTVIPTMGKVFFDSKFNCKCDQP